MNVGTFVLVKMTIHLAVRRDGSGDWRKSPSVSRNYCGDTVVSELFTKLEGEEDFHF